MKISRNGFALDLPFVCAEKRVFTLDGKIAERPGAHHFDYGAQPRVIPCSACATRPTRFSLASAQSSRTIRACLTALVNRAVEDYSASCSSIRGFACRCARGLVKSAIRRRSRLYVATGKFAEGTRIGQSGRRSCARTIA